MNLSRRSFLSMLGLAAPVAVVAPTYFFAPRCGWRPGMVTVTWGGAANGYGPTRWTTKTPAEILVDINAASYGSAGAFLVAELEHLDMRISPLGLALPRRYLRDIEVV